jgi:hypothetical protein
LKGASGFWLQEKHTARRMVIRTGSLYLFIPCEPPDFVQGSRPGLDP